MGQGGLPEELLELGLVVELWRFRTIPTATSLPFESLTRCCRSSRTPLSKDRAEGGNCRGIFFVPLAGEVVLKITASRLSTFCKETEVLPGRTVWTPVQTNGRRHDVRGTATAGVGKDEQHPTGHVPD